MIWFYAKSGEHRRCEVRQREGLLELVITEADGRERVEIFSDSVTLQKRSRELEREWKGIGWDGPFSRDY